MGVVLETVRADLVVICKGYLRDTSLTKTLPFAPGLINESTGETTIPGIFAIGFDIPGSGTHHYGTLPDGRIIYDNWLCWGGFAAQSTCSHLVARASEERSGLENSNQENLDLSTFRKK